tara:strand:- start:2228 stop:2485 length:258 start_codon:yes stop_codon:yes gene_type:complete
MNTRINDRSLFWRYQWHDLDDKEAFPPQIIDPTSLPLHVLLRHYRSNNMCIMEKHHSKPRLDTFRARAKRIEEIILNKYGGMKNE